jgi:hypothetical protein
VFPWLNDVFRQQQAERPLAGAWRVSPNHGQENLCVGRAQIEKFGPMLSVATPSCSVIAPLWGLRLRKISRSSYAQAGATTSASRKNAQRARRLKRIGGR